MRNAFILVFIAMASANILAQPVNSDCANAALLCAQQPISGNNSGGTNVPGFCPGTQSALWYTFTTNSVGGVVTVSINEVDCTVSPGMDTELSAIILRGDGSCQLASFQNGSDCTVDDSDFTLTSYPLQPETRYWLLIAGVMDGFSTTPAQCGFTIELSGPGANIIGVDLSAGPDVTIGQGESTQLQAIGPSFDWSPTAGLSGNGIPDPISAPTSTTRYALTVEIAGCTFSDTVIVEVVRLINPPNTFTPNGDGINDIWEIPSMADYPGAEVIIHDRWGQVVLRSTGYREPWDGTNNGRALSVGTYYYHIQLNQLEGQSPPYTGFVTIVR